MGKLERDFQAQLIKDLKHLFPGCMILKNDPGYQQGVPDLIVLFGRHWAMLECKKSASAGIQPNQEYYVRELDRMSYASFVYPENKKVVLNELQFAFSS